MSKQKTYPFLFPYLEFKQVLTIFGMSRNTFIPLAKKHGLKVKVQGDKRLYKVDELVEMVESWSTITLS